jgi:4-hydroxybenzoate polyprenyltransferase
MDPDQMKTWFATKGIVIGLCFGLPVLVALMIFGVNAITLLALLLCGGLIVAGIFAFPGTGGRRSDQAREDGDDA